MAVMLDPHLFYSSYVCKYIWECLGNYPAVVLRHCPLPYTDAACARVHSLPPDPEPAATTPGGVLPGEPSLLTLKIPTHLQFLQKILFTNAG